MPRSYNSTQTPTQRRLKAQAAADKRVARLGSEERTAMTEAARAKVWEGFLDAVDPDRLLDDDERNRRARQYRRGHMKGLNVLSLNARGVAEVTWEDYVRLAARYDRAKAHRRSVLERRYAELQEDLWDELNTWVDEELRAS